jgi:hypothetical protein
MSAVGDLMWYRGIDGSLLICLIIAQLPYPSFNSEGPWWQVLFEDGRYAVTFYRALHPLEPGFWRCV